LYAEKGKDFTSHANINHRVTKSLALSSFIYDNSVVIIEAAGYGFRCTNVVKKDCGVAIKRILLFTENPPPLSQVQFDQLLT